MKPSRGARRRRARLLLPLATVLAVVVLAPPSADAAPGLFVPMPPASRTVPPPGFRLNANTAVAIAARQPKVQDATTHGALIARPFVFGDTYWLIRFFRHGREQVQVELDGRNGAVRFAAAGRELDWPPLAHGEQGTQPTRLHWAMLISALLFVAPFVDPRRLLRVRHLDLLAIVALGVSFAFAEAGHVYTSTPLVYPPLLYLLGRFIWLAFRPARDDGFLTWLSPRALMVALLALLAARYVYIAVDGIVNDVGYASQFGADSIVHGYPLYNSTDTVHLDAYGPLAYLAYVPFVLIWPLHNLSHGATTSAQVASVVFDLGTVVALYSLGRRLRSQLLGLALAWGFAACPWTLFVLARATNDGLVALVLTIALLLAAEPLWRGVAIGVAATTKFAPLVLAALFARTDREHGLKPVLIYGVAVLLTIVVAVVAYLPDNGLRGFYDSTLGFQLSRTSPFSIWGLHPSWEPLRPVVTAVAAILAAGAFFLPRDRSLPALAAAGAALIIVTQLSAIHWYYFYVPWFMPYALVALFSRSYAGSVRNSASSSPRAVALNSS